jgi:hypothetical protein
MRFFSRFIPASLAVLAVALASPFPAFTQGPGSDPAVASALALPNAPSSQLQLASAGAEAAPDPSAAGPVAQQAAQSPAAGESSSFPAFVPQTADEKSIHDKAEEQLREQEKQRVMGVMATFNTTRNKDALPLSSGQKFQLFFKSATDPWPFLLAATVAGIGQAGGGYPEWGQGTQGYGKKFGAAYSDYFIGNFFGNAVLPSLLHEDPRYFQKGTGSLTGRFLWAASSTVWCKRDKGGWGPNWSNVVGNLIGTAIARVYYPASQRTVTDTVSDGLTVTAEGIVGSEVIEFWPDMVRHYRRKHAEKLARQNARIEAQSVPQAPSKDAPRKQAEPSQNQQ